jgi:hypothetical protein
MALVLQDRVSVNSTGSGTGNLALGSAYPGYRSFASCVPDGSIVYYAISNQAVGYDTQWEVGYGKYVLGTDTLVRNNGNSAETGVYSSSNSNAYVNFTAGTNGLQIFITQPSEQAVYQGIDGITTFPENYISVVGANSTAPTFATTLSSFVSNVPSFSQLVTQNQSADANASTDIVAYNDLGDGSSYFIDVGINSSDYNSGDYPIFEANDAYVFNSGNVAGTGAAGDISRLLIGTGTANSNVVIFGGSVNAGAEIATFVASNKNVGFANNISVTETVFSNNAVITNLAYSNGNLANASNSAVLVTQAYVDAAVSNGFHVHEPVNLATTTILSGTPTYNQPNGASNGVGATLTATGVGTLDIDGQNADFGFRILVQSQANAVQNGIYTVTTEGTGGVAYQLTRATDADTYVPQSDTGLGGGDYFFVDSGDTQAYFSFICTNDGTITFGTTPITFQNFSQVPVYTGTAPINVSSQTIALTGVVNETHGGTNTAAYTTGDTLYANATNTLTKLNIGSQYNALVVSGAGTPSWGTINLGSADAVSGSLGATNGGTGQTTYTLGDIIYSNASNTLAKLAGQTTTTQKFLSQTGNGTISAAPVWDTIPAGSITGLGTMSTQNANNVTITGGTLNNVAIGGSTANSGAFTTLTASGNVAFDTNVLFVDSVNNRVGIGNAAPVTTLDVVGIATVRNNGAAFNTTPNTNYGLNFQATSSGTTYITSYSGGGTTDIAFATNTGGAAATEKFRIGSAGQWGIGGATYGTAGQVFVSGGASAAPSWTTTVASATTANNIAGGAAGSIPYQTAANTTALLATGTGVLVGGTTPAYTTTPTLTGTNFSAIPNAALSNSSTTINGTSIALGGSGTVTANTTAALTAGTGISFSSGTTFNGGTAITISSSVTSPIPAGSVMLFYQSVAPTGWTQVTTAGLDDSALRIVTGSGGTTGGTTAFSTVFTNQTPTGSVSTTVNNTTATMASYTPAGSISVTVGAGTLAVGAGTFAVGATTLSTTQMPSHNHSLYYGDSGSPTPFNVAQSFGYTVDTGSGYMWSGAPQGSRANLETNTGSSGSHTHSLTGAPTISGSPSVTSQSFTGTAATLTQNAHNHTASSSFTGSALTLNVKYVNIIICSKN